jgi:MFS-type transporter involved in bile tolerance (Atg22 family)
MIITLAEFKSLPYYDNSRGDLAIEALIPLVESDYLLIRGMDWRRITGTITDGSAVITAASSLIGIEVGKLVDGTGIRGQIISITRGETRTITLDQKASASTEDVALTVYPAGVKLTAARMIAFQFNESQRDAALSSESIEDHTMQSDEKRIHGYPESVVAAIRRYGGVG